MILSGLGKMPDPLNGGHSFVNFFRKLSISFAFQGKLW